MSTANHILLVSGSPRRRELLAMIGVSFDVYNADIDESRYDHESPEQYVNRLSLEKARAGVERHGLAHPALGADTIVLLDGEILQKPVSRDEAEDMLGRLSGREHDVLSAVAVIGQDGTSWQDMNRTRVEFGEIPAHWRHWYAQTDEPMDKAGAYAVQGLTAQWVKCIDGSYSGVMGLPLFETAILLRKAGLALAG